MPSQPLISVLLPAFNAADTLDACLRSVLRRRAVLRLQEQLALIEADATLAAVGCHVRIAPRRDLTDGSREYETWINGLASAEDVSRDAFIECPVVHPTLFARRDRLAALGYRDRGWAEDYDLVLRMLIGGERIGVLPRRRLVWRDTPGRMWRTRGPYRRFLPPGQ